MNLATTPGNLLLLQPFHQHYYYVVVVVVLQVENLNFKHQTKTTSFKKLICLAPATDKILVFKTPKSSSCSSSSNQIIQAFPKSRLFSLFFFLFRFFVLFAWFAWFCTYFVFICLFSGLKTPKFSSQNIANSFKPKMIPNP